jgi:ATPase subunit of ABC transporter with duplicated ATPase domains
MMLFLQEVAYAHPNRDVLFTDISLFIQQHEKIALIGNNGSGKSTLLKILAGHLLPSDGSVHAASKPYYVPQLSGQFDDHTVAEALCVHGRLNALHEILRGEVSETNMDILGDDWAIEERCQEALDYWKLENIAMDRPMGTLSGGQKTKVFLAGMMVHEPQIVLLDEPSNHLDSRARDLLYTYLSNTAQTLVVVSHDRTLLNLLHSVYELGQHGVTAYGGNYAFYTQQKAIETEALRNELKNNEKALRKAREMQRESIERQQKLDARGKRKQEKEGLPTISMNTFRNNAEKSTSRIKEVHAEKVAAIAQELSHLRKELPHTDTMKMDMDSSRLHRGKVLIKADAINFGHENQPLWLNPMSFQITSGERISITGLNGSGKTTLIQLLLGRLEPGSGTISRAGVKAIYIDQDYSLIDSMLTVYEQAEKFNTSKLQEHDIKIRLHRYLFTKEHWNKSCTALSGGEKMRLMLCCLTIGNQAPDLMVLDEPTNNLDIQNIEILTAAINEYHGTLLVVSHDAYFLKQIHVERSISCDHSSSSSSTS